MTYGNLERRDLLRGVAGAATAPFFISSVAGQQAPDEGPAGVHVAYGRVGGLLAGDRVDEEGRRRRPGDPAEQVPAVEVSHRCHPRTSTSWSRSGYRSRFASTWGRRPRSAVPR